MLPRVFVREIRVVGSTVFSQERLAEVTSPYLNRELTDTDLESLRLALTVLYINSGYINSGAVIPDQTVTAGIITLQIVEGKLTDVVIEGNRWFRSDYLRNRLLLGIGAPLNISDIQEGLQILQQDDRIKNVKAELKPGVQRGEAVLKVEIQEETPFKVFPEYNNYQSPTVGAEQWLTTVVHQNLTGHGDILSFMYGGSSGIEPQIEASYTLPFTEYDSTLTLHYKKNNFSEVQEPFKSLDIVSKSDIYGITLRQPVYRTVNHEIALALTGEYIRNKTYLDGEPFSFNLGAQNGKSTVTALRFSQEWIYRTPAQVIALRSRFSLGIDAFGATTSPSNLPDTQFFSWLGQFQWARRLPILDMQSIVSIDWQLANKSLLPVEEIAVGGRYSVRGYRENQLVTDNALIASLETRIPIIRNRPWANSLEFAQFADFGRVWNTDFPTPSPSTIGSVGLGLRWESTVKYPFTWKPQFEFYWGLALKKIHNPDHNIQDDGIHFRFVIAVF